MIKSYQDLDVWKKSIFLVKKIYVVTKKFPKEEMYGLSNQMRRAAVSMPSNIAEGKARRSQAEYTHFLYIALGSVAELETQVIISRELEYIDCNKVEELKEDLNHISRMLHNLIKNLSSFSRKPYTVNR